MKIMPPSHQQIQAQQNLTGKENPKLWKVSKDFESIFVNQMISTMRNTVQSSGLIKKGQGEKVFQSMLDQKYAGHISDSGQIGLSQMIYQQLLRNMPGR